MDRRAALGLKPAPTRAAAGPGGDAPASAAAYFRLPTGTGTILRRDGRRGVMSVEMGLDVADAALRLRAQQSQPRLAAAHATVIQAAARNLAPAAPPDVEQLARALQAETDRVLGRPGARLLLGTVMVV